MARKQLKGSCLCGSVRYEVTGAIEAMACCHCVQCRKASGAEFATNATVATRDFRLIAGEDRLSAFESSPGQWRVFCAGCGSPILKRFDEMSDQIRLRLGNLDTPLERKPLIRVFYSERASWTEIHDDIPCFETLPGRDSSD